MIQSINYDNEFAFDRNNISELEYIGGLYFLFDKYDNLLYIGKTKNFKQRLNNYFSDKWRTLSSGFRDVSLVKIIKVDNELSRTEMEKQMILKLKPSLNTVHTLRNSEMRKKEIKVSRVAISIDEELLKQIKDISIKENRNVSQQISKVMGDYINALSHKEQPRK